MELNLIECEICNRNFNADRIEKHRSVCQRAGSRKVKKFDLNEHKFNDMGQEQLRLIKRENVNEAAERKKEAKKAYTLTFEKNATTTTTTSPKSDVM